mmetsp:Transcript_98123/g.282065  ORF Transcript_98123/g.282065 Transcript_98123/m.282065 type:complete len:434 (-) Transcript_98123:343-1644(-)
MAPSTSKLLVFIACLAGTRHADAASAQLFQSSGTNGDRLARKADLPLVSDFEFSGPTIEISKDSTDQVIQGFGGAFTEASALVFKSLPADKQQKVLDLYFGPYGIGYTLGRVHMNSCDFSPKSYSFDDVDGDFSLAHFDNGVSHDTEVMIPLILAAQDKVREANGAELKLIAAPWSPPAWMKTNGQMDGSDKPGLQDGCQAVWASYFPKWLSAYKARGISIWAITPQNEPENPAGWEACVYDAEQELQFLGEHLGPTLRADHPDVKIFIFDHNKDHVYDWAKALYADPRAQEYAAGVAFHWYSGLPPSPAPGHGGDVRALPLEARLHFGDRRLGVRRGLCPRHHWRPQCWCHGLDRLELVLEPGWWPEPRGQRLRCSHLGQHHQRRGLRSSSVLRHGPLLEVPRAGVQAPADLPIQHTDLYRGDAALRHMHRR